MSEELKPVLCGCGGEAKVQGLNVGERWFVFCRQCHTDSDLYDTKAEAIEAWNLAMGRKIGEWIKWEAPNGIDCGIECSECGYKCNAYPGYGSAFCPTCGAKMKNYFEDVPMEYFESGGK